ncbi:outer membrane protein [Bradyrhizobium sp. I1.14.4]|uniref:outer membrane protein n=1 Tax=unclassified Bradyrhizobium TaxID=2631580 RepID=UPI003D23248A
MTGYYIGINGGWGSSHNRWDFNGVTSEGGYNSTGGTIGGHIGYRWQIFNTVYGIEGNWADFSGSNVRTAFPADTIGTKAGAFGLLTGHIGYAFNAVLLYAKGGAAVTSNTYHVNSVAARPRLPESTMCAGAARSAPVSKSASHRASQPASSTTTCPCRAAT